ncbi:MAG: winged helix-turn-helix domain-containing protein, partial [Pseudomonadota bacterium]
MTRWHVGDFLFDANANRLVGGGRARALEPRASALLAYFCAHPDRDIDRDELLASVWRGRVVSDNSISRVVVMLRKALGDDARVSRYIATVPTVGYRFIASVRAAPSEAQERSGRRRVVGFAVLFAGVALLTGAAGYTLWQGSGPSATSPRVAVVPVSRLPIP